MTFPLIIIQLPEQFQELIIETFATTRYWAEIDLDNLLFNFQSIQKKVPLLKLLTVLKADGYGQGSVQIAKTLEEAGSDYFAVALPEEALQLRRNGISSPILILGMIAPEWIPLMLEHDITITIGDWDSALQYVSVIPEEKTLNIHICLDTGMNRIGLNPENAVEQIRKLADFPAFEIEGIWTHFPAADDLNEQEFTRKQISTFHSIIHQLEQLDIHIPWRHYANSDAIACFPPELLDGTNMARPGIILYGTINYSSYGLEARPVTALRARIMKIHPVRKGESVSYARTWYAQRDSLIATIGIGYGDGLPRALSNKISCLVHGQKIPQVGRISMDQMMLDVTDIPQVTRGDIATLVGTDGDETISVKDISSLLGTGSSEFLSQLGKRIPRVYYRNSKCIHSTSYLDHL